MCGLTVDQTKLNRELVNWKVDRKLPRVSIKTQKMENTKQRVSNIDTGVNIYLIRVQKDMAETMEQRQYAEIMTESFPDL